MKAVKIYKIQWNLGGLSPEEEKEVKSKLPKVKGFMAQDDFDVVENVPRLLKKKFGYDVMNYSYSEIEVIETFEGLLRSFTPKGYKHLKLFKHNGELTDFGTERFENLKDAIKWRFREQAKGTSDEDMPKLLDKVMLAWETITGEELMAFVNADKAEKTETPVEE